MARFTGATPFGSAASRAADPNAPKVTWRNGPPAFPNEDEPKWQGPSPLFQLLQMKHDPKQGWKDPNDPKESSEEAGKDAREPKGESREEAKKDL